MLLRRKPENWDVVLNFLCLPKSTISAFGDVLEKEISFWEGKFFLEIAQNWTKFFTYANLDCVPVFLLVSRLNFSWVEMVGLVWFCILLFHHGLCRWYLGNLGICFTASAGGDGFGNINVGYTLYPQCILLRAL